MDVFFSPFLFCISHMRWAQQTSSTDLQEEWHSVCKHTVSWDRNRQKAAQLLIKALIQGGRWEEVCVCVCVRVSQVLPPWRSHSGQVLPLVCLFNTHHCIFFFYAQVSGEAKITNIQKKKQCTGAFDEAGIGLRPQVVVSKQLWPGRDKVDGRWAAAALLAAFLSYQRPANAKVQQKEDISDLLCVYPENPSVLHTCAQGKSSPDVFFFFCLFSKSLHCPDVRTNYLWHVSNPNSQSSACLICMPVSIVASWHKRSLKTFGGQKIKNRTRRRIGCDLRLKVPAGSCREATVSRLTPHAQETAGRVNMSQFPWKLKRRKWDDREGKQSNPPMTLSWSLKCHFLDVHYIPEQPR